MLKLKEESQSQEGATGTREACGKTDARPGAMVVHVELERLHRAADTLSPVD